MYYFGLFWMQWWIFRIKSALENFSCALFSRIMCHCKCLSSYISLQLKQDHSCDMLNFILKVHSQGHLTYNYGLNYHLHPNPFWSCTFDSDLSQFLFFFLFFFFKSKCTWTWILHRHLKTQMSRTELILSYSAKDYILPLIFYILLKSKPETWESH